MKRADQRLFELFAEFLERLRAIENYAYGTFPDVTCPAIATLEQAEILRISPVDSLPFVENILDRIHDFTWYRMDELEEKIFRVLHKAARLGDKTKKGGKQKSQEKGNVKEEMQARQYANSFRMELELYYDELSHLSELIQREAKLLELPPVLESGDSQKLILNLTVPEVVGFVKVLIKGDVIPKNTKPEQVVPIISAHFGSKKQLSIGETSIRKKIYPDEETLDKLVEIFGKLHRTAMQMKKEKN